MMEVKAAIYWLRTCGNDHYHITKM